MIRGRQQGQRRERVFYFKGSLTFLGVHFYYLFFFLSRQYSVQSETLSSALLHALILFIQSLTMNRRNDAPNASLLR